MSDPDSRFTTSSVASSDGTTIGYRSIGTSGPGLILIQGAMATQYHFQDLAILLSSHYTVHLPDRRGRGLSPKEYTSSHHISRDVEDVEAVMEVTRSTRVFGLSSGAMITLEVGRTLEKITHVAVYEPPFYPQGIDFGGISRLNKQIEEGDYPSAMVSALKTSGTLPPFFSYVPDYIARLGTSSVLFFESYKSDSNPYPKLRDLVPGVRYDFNVVGSLDGKMDQYSSLGDEDKKVLLISGSSSPTYLKESIRKLNKVIKGSKHVEFVGLDHGSSWNKSAGGKPEVIVEEMIEFFK